VLKYLTKKNNTYWFRRRISKTKEIVLSLKTKDYNKAILRHSYIDFKIKELIFNGVLEKMTVSEIRKIVDKYKSYMINNEYNEFEDKREKEISMEIDGTFFGGHTKEAVKQKINQYENLHNLNDDKKIEEEALKILNRSNLIDDFKQLSTDKDKKIFFWELFKAEWDLLHKSLDEQKNLLSYKIKTINSKEKDFYNEIFQEMKNHFLNSNISDFEKQAYIQNININNPKNEFISIIKLKNMYINENKEPKDWSDKNIRDLEYVFKNFADYYDNKNINDLTRIDFSEFRDKVLKNLPKRINQNIFKNKNIFEILEIMNNKKIEKVGIVTINKHLRRVHQIFNWAENNGYIRKNFTKDLAIIDKSLSKNKRSKKVPYDKKDLIGMLDSPYFNNEILITLKQNPQFVFFPLIAMYTGAKQAEIALLETKDIKKINNIWCFEFNKNVKTKYTNRITPISNELLDLGFLKYLNYQKKNNEKMLFEKVKIFKSGGVDFTNKFSTYNKKFITNNKNKTFYSFKHFVNQLLKNQKTPVYIINDIVGHSDGKGNKDVEVYGDSSQPIEILKESIDNCLVYDYLDFSKVKKAIDTLY
jgi:integrase